ncbi:hypothetical protein PVAG01_11298 [Phlyctema vagabunda]|uniref:Uncharacterized protein n=1 Tax=Phlyctema vagabunda TaxID=108571 RepID=A0ABR4P1X7_9HELO
MHKVTVVAALAVLAQAVGAQSTVDLLFWYLGQSDIAASVVGSDATATTFSIACETGANGETTNPECYVGADFLYTQAPSSVHYTISFTGYGDSELPSGSPTPYTVSELACALTGTSSAECAATILRPDNPPQITSLNYNGAVSKTDEMFETYPVVITAGTISRASSVPASTTVTSSGPNVSSTSSTHSGSTSIASSSAAASLSSSDSATVVTSTGTSTSTGGMAMITGNAKWAIGAAAGLAVAGL